MRCGLEARALIGPGGEGGATQKKSPNKEARGGAIGDSRGQLLVVSGVGRDWCSARRLEAVSYAAVRRERWGGVGLRPWRRLPLR